MKKLLPKLWAKITALILFVVFAVTLAASGVGIAFLIYMNVYADGGRSVREQVISGNIFRSQMSTVDSYYKQYLHNQADGSSKDLSWYTDLFDKKNSNFFFTVTDNTGHTILSNYHDDDYQYKAVENHTIIMNAEPKTESKIFRTNEEANQFLESISSRYETNFSSCLPIYSDGNTLSGYKAEIRYIKSDLREITITGYIRSDLAAQDSFYNATYWLNVLIGLRYGLIVICAVSLILLLVLFIFLLCSAGHKEDCEGIHLNWIDRIPFDLYAAALFFLGVTTVYAADSFYSWEMVVFLVAVGILWLPLAMSFLMTFAARAKAGTWWKNTVIYGLIHLSYKILRWLFHGIAYAIRSLPLFWKTGLVWAALSLFELIAISSTDMHTIAGWWCFEKLLLTPAIVLVVINLRKLQKGGQQIAAGDLSHTIDLRHMYLDFKKHGENLNSIGSGMQRAVDERMKSERLKTELITNVSHDIKTPLTSIVNFVDLLKKEDVASEKAKEYIDVLDRQSARLKKLTEDLVEASKASTGNMPVTMERTDVNVLLSQAAGEYADKFANRNLEPIINTDPHAGDIYADGKLLWRVFDNLMSNICKYALEGTRVYLATEVRDHRVIISFKNISQYPLNISSDELIERFVRGDSSRSSDGSGLGLSIARSLTDLQNGRFDLVVDGDLFKAVLSFELCG